MSSQSNPESPTPGRRGRKRSVEAERAVLDAAYRLLLEQGLHATTMESIATAAGVSKATIYKWWPNRASVIMTAFLREAGQALPYPEELQLDSIFSRLLKMAEEFCGPMGTMISALIAEGQSDPEIAQAFRDGYVSARREQGVEIVRDAIARGLIKPGDPDVVLDILYAPLYYRLLVGHKPLTRAFVREHVDLVMQGLLGPNGTVPALTRSRSGGVTSGANKTTRARALAKKA
ncbi:TetR/AcrR family transcriptional regulator [Pandoraea commovens]|uniref:Putative HTH-type transcriptional regulator n=1 Tax=Pandoraea commovens TaxID=2508289 RepID=A0A5E4XU09_9BURK|nr:TetR/AcrR family transcriptional regulator [Pandoraea commovens]VVE39820.1 putative HTH-type transcriptional regulator [Pandoraea commovens]